MFLWLPCKERVYHPAIFSQHLQRVRTSKPPLACKHRGAPPPALAAAPHVIVLTEDSSHMTLQCYDWGLWNVGHSDLSHKKAQSALITLSHSEHTFFYLFPQKDGCICSYITWLRMKEAEKGNMHRMPFLGENQLPC